MNYEKEQMRRDDIIRRREAGETYQQIGDVYGISRERVRQLCKKYGVDKPSVDLDIVALNAVTQLKEGKSLKAVAGAANMSPDRLRRLIEKTGYDVSVVLEYGKANSWNGRRFDMWEVQDGSYRREHPAHRRTSVAYVTCKCDCGTIREVSTGNLLNRTSRGCGCRNTDGGRKNIPWLCRESGIRLETSMDLHKATNIPYLSIVRKLNRGDDCLIDSTGRTWTPLRNEAVEHNPGTFGGRQRQAEIAEKIESAIVPVKPVRAELVEQDSPKAFFKRAIQKLLNVTLG